MPLGSLVASWRLRDWFPMGTKRHRAGHLAMPSPVVNRRWINPFVQAVIAMAQPRRRRCSIIASTPATSERALPPVAGSISGTDEGVGTVRSGETPYIGFWEFESLPEDIQPEFVVPFGMPYCTRGNPVGPK